MCLAQGMPIRFPCVQIPARSLHTSPKTQPLAACVCLCVCVEGGDNCTSLCVRVCLCTRVNEIERWGDKLYDINYSDQPCLREKERERLR